MGNESGGGVGEGLEVGGGDVPVEGFHVLLNLGPVGCQAGDDLSYARLMVEPVQGDLGDAEVVGFADFRHHLQELMHPRPAAVVIDHGVVVEAAGVVKFLAEVGDVDKFIG